MVAPSPSVAVVVLNWNNAEDTLACVASCRALTWPSFRIVVVDNGSDDGSAELLRARLPDLEIIATGANLGFAGGNNVGIRHALSCGAEYLWLVNNDAVVHPEALSALVVALETHRGAAAAGSKIYFHDAPATIWHAGGMWEKGRLKPRQRGAYQPDRGQFDAVREVGSVSGCSMLLRARAVEEIGALEESYFLYWEDTEWCARARERGHSVLFVPQSRVWHKVSATVASRSQRQYYYNTRNGLHFCRSHDPLSLPRLFLYLTADVGLGLLRGNTAMLRGYRRGILDFVRGRSGKSPEA